MLKKIGYRIRLAILNFAAKNLTEEQLAEVNRKYKEGKWF